MTTSRRRDPTVAVMNAFLIILSINSSTSIQTSVRVFDVLVWSVMCVPPVAADPLARFKI